jgi:hypothetical protein
VRQPNLRPEFVEFIPERLNEGTLYISRRYRTAAHLCCCGCRLDVVTPLNAAKWHLTEHPGGAVSLWPSIGNWSFPCKSHYFVVKNRIQWAEALSPKRIAAVQNIDQYDAIMLGKDSRSRWTKLRGALVNVWVDLVAAVRKIIG